MWFDSAVVLYGCSVIAGHGVDPSYLCSEWILEDLRLRSFPHSITVNSLWIEVLVEAEYRSILTLAYPQFTRYEYRDLI